MDNVNLHGALIELIATKRNSIGTYASGHEAYAIIKDRAETAMKQASPEKLMKEFWSSVKEGNDEAVHAYAAELESQARNTAVAFAELSAFAAKVAECI